MVFARRSKGTSERSVKMPKTEEQNGGKSTQLKLSQMFSR